MKRQVAISKESRMCGYKLKLYPTDEQKAILDKHLHLFRYVYNWALGRAIEYYQNNNEYIGLRRLETEFSEIRNKTDWLQDIPLRSARYALLNLDGAFFKFFMHKAGFPRFKPKKSMYQKVHYRNEPYAFNIDQNSVRIAGFRRNERILCKSHNVPADTSMCYSCTVTFDGINYWVSFNVACERTEPIPEKTDQSIGIDLGMKKFAQLSNGKVYQKPRKIDVVTKRIRRQQSRLSKMRNTRLEAAAQAKTKLEDIPLTKNEIKLREKNIKLRIRRKNMMNSFLHQTTTEIAKLNPKRIVVEDLQVSRFVHQRVNNRDELYHSMWYKFREILQYKCLDRGIEFVVAATDYPSSQICSVCGSRRKPSNRTYICHNCGARIDRDLNAALNLSMYYA